MLYFLKTKIPRNVKIHYCIPDKDMATEVHTKNLDGNMTKDSAVTHNMSITSESSLESSASLKGTNITDKGNNEHLIIKQDKY